MKLLQVIVVVALSLIAVDAFVPSNPSPFGLGVCLDAKHVNKKAAKRMHHRRPRKSRPSDINRKPTDYPTFEKPPEYTITDAPPVLATKPEAPAKEE
mmetsp:Transcript_18475/g.25423  ORF Transcript_18475/g.25423 Transcript_18475/m.25423 type:complete len:97 (+) Transcript_18475:155-445(+)|eukprot:CAMPEP_0185723150 /NCGR_PEP_ID=MMETSP1171-20130828/87_1 /TAXON_ID=374046 /ORGANISM="Helicotheca tamensis, Strain CCMP826" /LENGTH=96 /DNA_ID=CAMNT_0028390815 /DNA_START=148 /DNA_END=438 /DNA_ORIENTATION=-